MALSRSTRVAIILLAMVVTFSVVFVIVNKIGSEVRAKHTITPIPVTPTPIPVTPIPTPIPVTPTPIPATPNSITPTSILPQTIATSTIVPTAPPKTQECPQPSTDSYGSMEWSFMGDTIHGDVEDRELEMQPVAISQDGTRVVLGSPWGSSSDTAKVKVLDFDGASWNEVGIFSGMRQNDFGETIALSGDGQILAIGVKESDEAGVNSGQVEVYRYTKGTDWKPMGGKLTGIQAADFFGWSVALSADGKRLAVGAPRSDPRGSASGSVHVFEFKGDDWIQMGQAIVGESAWDESGTAVSLSEDGSTVAIGSPNSNENGGSSGSLRVFRYSSVRREIQEDKLFGNTRSTQEDEQWILLGQEILGIDSDDYFGYSLSINAKGNIVAAGTNHKSKANYARVFYLQNNKWHPMGETIYGQDYFGYSVSLASKAQRIAVGSDNSSGGRVKIYDYNENNWKQIHDIVAPTSEKYFAKSVSLSVCGDKLAIGSIYDGNPNDHGLMVVYQFKQVI